MGAIRLLDELTANRIAAGEVVERPASVAKELMENSLDAGATAITLEIRDGGISYLRVTDNGSGIAEEDCRLAFERHATSKIRSGDDLTRIQSLGFRGEALPSIASVSKVELTTRVKEADSGVRLLLSAGQIEDVRAAGCPYGTSFVVKDLFFNTPARRKFLKKPAVEAGYVADVAAHLALGRPDIALRFVHNGKTVYQTTGNGDLRAAVYRLYDKELAAALQPVQGSQGSVSVEGLVGVGPVASRGNRNHEYFFLNGRYIRSQVLSQALEAAVAERVMIGKFPFCVLNIQVPLESVDVNVHPSKLEVRFKDDFPIRENLLEILQTSFPAARAEGRHRFIQPAEQLPLSLPRRQEAAPPGQARSGYPETPVGPSSTAVSPATPAARPRPALRDGGELPLSALLPKEGKTPAVPPRAAEDAPAAMPEKAPAPAEDTSPAAPAGRPDMAPKPPVRPAGAPGAGEAAEPDGRSVLREALRPRVIGQLFGTYLLAERGEEMLIIDQHAAHERILYEGFKKSLGTEGLSQPLLTPYLFHVNPREEALLFEQLDQLRSLGFEIESFGPRTFRVLAVPQILGEPMVQGFVGELLDSLEELSHLRELDLKRDRLVLLSCHKAIKAGDQLSKQELEDLLTLIEEEAIPLTCPHGRPVLMKMTKRELERKFKRIQ